MCSKSKIGYYTWFILEDIRGILWIIMWGFPNDKPTILGMVYTIYTTYLWWFSEPGPTGLAVGQNLGSPWGKKNIKLL